MTVLSGKKEISISSEQLREKTAGYHAVCVDIGTGDGKRLYRTAQKDTGTFYIGIDPVRENMLETAKKTERKPSKGGISNLLLAVAAVENLPDELYSLADDVSVFFPWGTLLECIIKPLEEPMNEIRKIAKDGAGFTFVTTYDPSFENNEINKRQLPEISIEYLENEYKEKMSELGFYVEEVSSLSANDVKKIGTQWAKRLISSRVRKFYCIKGYIKK